MSRMEIADTFILDNKPIKIISGAMHYFRTVPEYWEDRLRKLKALGFNTVETYVAWNMHEKEKGQFDFDGILDIEKFIDIAESLGLYVIVRPSPYICAEWEFGGLPYWLLKDKGMRLRVSYAPFLDAVERYYRVLIPKLARHQIDVGGPIILMQIENEYGYYATDKSYLEFLHKLMRDLGITVPLFTSDGPYPENLAGGSLPDVLMTGNFGSRTVERFDTLKECKGKGPLMCSEFWIGWFDHWGNGGHMKGNLEENVADFDDMLRLGNANVYMFCGGTNFGFMNGSNYYDCITPDVTSYDYDALLSEDGRIGEKYLRFKEVVGKYAELPEVTLPGQVKRMNYGSFELKDKVSLFSVYKDIAQLHESVYPESMEELNQGYGYILYCSDLLIEDKIEKIRLYDANDRALMYVNNEHFLTLYDRELLSEHEVSVETSGSSELAILVENMGRVNFGPAMEKQRKGIARAVSLNGHIHNNWREYCLPLDEKQLSMIDFTRDYREGEPAFYRFECKITEIGDTFIDLPGFSKGCVFVNGFNIGRFWEIGPQKRLYIPGPILKEGINEIIVFETEGVGGSAITLSDEPSLG